MERQDRTFEDSQELQMIRVATSPRATHTEVYDRLRVTAEQAWRLLQGLPVSVQA